VECLAQKSQTATLSSYIPRGKNVLQIIFKYHFNNFKEQYNEKYVKSYGNYRLDRIIEVVEEFLKCRMGTQRLTILQ